MNGRENHLAERCGPMYNVRTAARDQPQSAAMGAAMTSSDNLKR
jgi:hypothetical protein